MKRCSVPGCGGRVASRGLCNGHYMRLHRHGELFPDRPISKRQRLRPSSSTPVRYKATRGYVQILRGGMRVMEHRAVMEATLDRPLASHENVHHINGVRSDNRPENLELWAVPQPRGQRPEDLADWVIANYRDLVIERLNKT